MYNSKVVQRHDICTARSLATPIPNLLGCGRQRQTFESPFSVSEKRKRAASPKAPLLMSWRDMEKAVRDASWHY